MSVARNDNLGAAVAASIAPLPWVNVRDPQYGAIGDGTTDDTAAIAAACAVSGAHRVLIPAGTYLVTDTITIDQSRVNIHGEGQQVTIINFVPTSGGKPVFSFDRGASVSYECSLTDLGISSSDTTYQKIGVRLEDTSKFRMERVAIGSAFHGAGAVGAGTTIGLQIRGRELGVIKDVTISTDQPISIESNPNTSQILDLDLWHFEDIYTQATGDNNHWNFESGVQVTDFVLDGANIGTDNGLSLGTGTGDYMYWVDSSPAPVASSYGFTVRNARLEGATGGGAYAFNIQKASTTLRGVLFEGCHTGSANLNKGWYLRGCADVTLINCFYQGTAEAFNADGANCDSITFIGCHFLAASTKSLASMWQHFALGTNSDTTEPLSPHEVWRSSGYYGWKINGNTLQSFVVLITNDGGTIKHSIFGSSSASGALGNYSNTITGASATTAATPNVAAGVDFTSGAGINNAATHQLILNTAAQTNADDFGIAVIELNSTTTDIAVRLANVSSDVNGTTRNRLALVFTNATSGAAFTLTTGNIGSGTSIRVKVLAAIK